jgi:glycosyltransferase involved in cell wall biosynthesis
MLRLVMYVAMVGTELASLASPTGGLENAVRSWASGLQEAGHRVVLIDACPDQQPEPLPGGFDWVDLKDPGALPTLLVDLGVEVVQVNNRPMWESGPVHRLDTFHNYLPAWGLPEGCPLAEVGVRIKGRSVSAVSFALAREVAATLGLPTGKVSCTYPTVDDVFFSVHHRGGGGIVFPNRLMEKKGVRDMLEVLAHPLIAEKTVTFCDYTTPFLSSGKEFRALRRAVQSSGARLIPAATSRAEMAGLYAAADLVVSIAREPEGLGLVPLEAQAVGAPVLTAGPGGLAEATFLPNVHLPTWDVEALAQAMEASLSRPVSEEPRGRVAKSFSTGATCASLLDAIRQACSGNMTGGEVRERPNRAHC